MKELILRIQVEDEDADFLKNMYPNLKVRYNGKNMNLAQAIGLRMGIDAEVVDHVNRDATDNTRNNLRGATRTENNQNTSLKVNNTSGYKGVSWYKKKNKWQVKVCINKKQIHLGYFDDVIEAALIYDEKAKELFGKFAALNFPT